MKSPMLKRRLNPFLLATIVLVLSILAGLSVLYQGQLSSLLQEKNDLSTTLEQKNQRIQSLENENSNLSERVSSQQDDIETYLQENELLESQINSLNSTVQNLEQQLDESERESSDLEREIDNFNNTLFLICSGNNTIENGEEYCNRHGHEYR